MIKTSEWKWTRQPLEYSISEEKIEIVTMPQGGGYSCEEGTYHHCHRSE